MDSQASGSGGVFADVEAMTREIGLKENYLDDVFVEEEEALPPQDTRLMATLRFSCLGDWERVMELGLGQPPSRAQNAP